ncbi:Gp15 family bacteriophage protein [Actinopolyspora halophila]|uniref:Gp15 family bacteriophage protein n=1 Tax=Actinopolyspora halophila TaxID=1850 RepID=UPI0003807E10|nr:Gp15 family bacteriophage protein [Actinopolyspora halophila]
MAIEADFMREYRIDDSELARLSWRRFLVLLHGLSPEALYPQLVEKTPKQVDDTEAATIMSQA